MGRVQRTSDTEASGHNFVTPRVSSRSSRDFLSSGSLEIVRCPLPCQDRRPNRASVRRALLWSQAPCRSPQPVRDRLLGHPSLQTELLLASASRQSHPSGFLVMIGHDLPPGLLVDLQAASGSAPYHVLSGGLLGYPHPSPGL